MTLKFKVYGKGIFLGEWHGDSADDVCSWVSRWYGYRREEITAEWAGQ